MSEEGKEYSRTSIQHTQLLFVQPSAQFMLRIRSLYIFISNTLRSEYSARILEIRFMVSNNSELSIRGLEEPLFYHECTMIETAE